MRKGIKSAIAVIGIVGLMGAAGPAALANDRDVERRGSCSGRSDWKLKLSPEDGRLEVEFEVDQNRVGHRWRVKIRQNGERIFRGVRETPGIVLADPTHDDVDAPRPAPFVGPVSRVRTARASSRAHRGATRRSCGSGPRAVCGAG
jgi:hypothetical protein